MNQKELCEIAKLAVEMLHEKIQQGLDDVEKPIQES